MIFFLMLVSTPFVAAIRTIDGQCYFDCDLLYNPVCGSDGKTYNNACELQAYADCLRVRNHIPPLSMTHARPCRDGLVVDISSFEWSLQAKKVKLDKQSPISLDVTASVANFSDAIEGSRLWRVGIFASKWNDGFGERYGYKKQILKKKHMKKKALPGGVIKFRKITTKFDVSQIGCYAIIFFCVEFSKNSNPTVEFKIQAGIQFDTVILCKQLECQRPDVKVSEYDLPPTCLMPCTAEEDASGPVCGTDRLQYTSQCALTKAVRCNGTEVETEYTGPCLPEVITEALFWSAAATDSVVQHPTLDIEAILFTTTGPLIEGDNLWQVGIYGSAYEDGHGDRVEYNPQIMNREQSSKTLQPGFPFQLNIVVPFNIRAVGCGNYQFLCLELQRNSSTATKFVLRSGDNDYVQSCRRVPCDEASLRPRVSLQQIRWSLRVAQYQFGRPSNLTISISALVSNDSNRIQNGSRLWRVGVFGSRLSDGSDKIKLDYIPQALSRSLTPPEIYPGRILDFPPIPVTFDISQIGCGDYIYLCIMLSKGVNAEPDFNLANEPKKIISCQQLRCIPPPPTLPPSAGRAILQSLQWNMTVVLINTDGTLRVKMAVDITPSPMTDTIQGDSLWQVGIFTSNATSGSIARVQYIPQLLSEKQMAQPLLPSQDLVFQPVFADLDITNAGCEGSLVQYICLEFRRAENPNPYFELPLGGSDRVHSCRHLPCQDMTGSS